MFNLCCLYFVLTIAVLNYTIFAKAETSECFVKIELLPKGIIKFSNHEELCKCLGYDKYESKINSTKLEACVIETSDQEGKLGLSAESICKCTGFKIDAIEETRTFETIPDYFYGVNVTSTDYITEDDVSTISSVTHSDNHMISPETMALSTTTAYETSTTTSGESQSPDTDDTPSADLETERWPNINSTMRNYPTVTESFEINVYYSEILNNTLEKTDFTNSEYEFSTTTTITSKNHFSDETTNNNVSNIDYTTDNLSTSTSESVTISNSYFSVGEFNENFTFEIEKLKTLDTYNSTDNLIIDYDESTETVKGTDLNSTATDYPIDDSYFAANIYYSKTLNNSLESIDFNKLEYSPDKKISNTGPIIDQTTGTISPTFESVTSSNRSYPELSKWFEEDKLQIFDTQYSNEVDNFMIDSDSAEIDTDINYTTAYYTSYKKSGTQNRTLEEIDLIKSGNKPSNITVGIEKNYYYPYPETYFGVFENKSVGIPKSNGAFTYSNPFLSNKSRIAPNTTTKIQINIDKSFDKMTTVIVNHDKYFKGFSFAKNNLTTSTVKNEQNNMNDRIINPTLVTYLTTYNHSNNAPIRVLPFYNTSVDTLIPGYFLREKLNATRFKTELENYSNKTAAIEDNKTTSSRSLYSTVSQLFDRSFFKGEEDITSDDEDYGEGSGLSKLNGIDDNNFKKVEMNYSHYSHYNNLSWFYNKMKEMNTKNNKRIEESSTLSNDVTTTEPSVEIYLTQNNPRNKPASVRSEGDNDSFIIPLIVLILGLCAIIILSLLLGAFLYTWCLKSGSYSLYSASKAHDNLELGSTYRRSCN